MNALEKIKNSTYGVVIICFSTGLGVAWSFSQNVVVTPLKDEAGRLNKRLDEKQQEYIESKERIKELIK